MLTNSIPAPIYTRRIGLENRHVCNPIFTQYTNNSHSGEASAQDPTIKRNAFGH